MIDAEKIVDKYLKLEDIGTADQPMYKFSLVWNGYEIVELGRGCQLLELQKAVREILALMVEEGIAAAKGKL